jgi:hypothetical protein
MCINVGSIECHQKHTTKSRETIPLSHLYVYTKFRFPVVYSKQIQQLKNQINYFTVVMQCEWITVAECQFSNKFVLLNIRFYDFKHSFQQG